MEDLVPAKYISLFFTDLGVFTPEVVAAELAQMFEWVMFIVISCFFNQLIKKILKFYIYIKVIHH